MPIYAYRCTNCGQAKDVLQKMSDPLLTVCPFCGESTFVKQLTAAGFQLKGSGWYVTDFRGGDKPASGGAGEGKSDSAGASEGGKTEGGKADGGKADAPAPAAAKSEASPAPAPAAAPAPPSSEKK